MPVFMQVIGNLLTGGVLFLIRQLGKLASKPFRRGRSDLRLSIHWASQVMTPLSTTCEPYKHVALTATYLGQRAVQVTGMGLVLKDGSKIAALTNVGGVSSFPAVLDERNPSVTAAFEFLPLTEQLTGEGQAGLSGIYCTLGTGEMKTAGIPRHLKKILTRRYGVTAGASANDEKPAP